MNQFQLLSAKRYLHLPEGHISVSAFSENPEYLPVRQLVRHMAWKSCMRLAGKCSDRHFYEPDPIHVRIPDDPSENNSCCAPVRKYCQFRS